ncbi:ABC transporter ATP-binding protein [Methanospirillum stamsii]|uniref:Multidrug ABC transporter ATP-binding protein n=1 Tax=Methanospirillum stamsii TaxID=1277351 RepID=A0A2V2NLU0_9EURY|nr:ABC transporter ATP-binding protein [Methanospirillum stamsii]PWR76293.1 multidrug ABC transporter ATP-binding protein [Methanospirillum stamsii]
MTISNYKRLFTIFYGYRRWLLLSIILNIIVAGGTLAIPALSAALIDYGILTGDFENVLDIGFLMLIAAIIAGICQIANASIAVWFAGYCSHILRKQTFEKIQTLSFGNIDRFRASDLLVRLTTDIMNVKTAVMQSIMQLMQAPLLLIGTIIILHFMAPSLMWIMITLLILLTISLLIYFVIVEPAFSQKQKKIDGVNNALRETLTGIRVVKAFVRQNYEIEKFQNATKELRTAALRPQHVMAYLMPAIIAISIMGFGAVYYFGGMEVITGTGLQIGNVTSAAQYILILMMPLLIIAIVLPFITQANASLVRIFEVLDSTPEIRDPENPALLNPETVKGRVVFEHVSLSYRNNAGEPEGEVLKDINLVVNPGETIGFLGATGSGKSSLISLIPRFYDVTEGKVTIDGVDVRDITQSVLRKIVGICLQEPVLFSGTIRDTITFGNREMTDDDMLVASMAADVDGFVKNIPEEYDGKVARRGSNFSGGQRQRLAIARSLATKPKILIMDDSTSACDVATEARIQDAIVDMMKTATKFIVAQRISSVITADKIVLMEHGRIIATGTHAELLESNALYQEIYESQLGRGFRAGGAS